MSLNIATDSQQRETALDPTRSFIVQAPAGSGKTSILVQRYLVLLARASVPEEIIAITFTRKAAAEMRNRVLQVLMKANQISPQSNKHEQKTQELAKAVLKNDLKHNWNLLQNTQRLNIQTIDAFCQKIALQSPIAASYIANANIVEDVIAESYYQKAVHDTIKFLINNPENSNYQSLKILLLHLNNDISRLETLCATMLKRRNQWLPHLTPLRTVKDSNGNHLTINKLSKNNSEIFSNQELRTILENSLAYVGYENLHDFLAVLPHELIFELDQLIKFAITNLKENNPDSPILHLVNFTEKITQLDLNVWLGIGELLLTKEFDWRKQITSKQGFPAPSEKVTADEKSLRKSMKNRMESLLQSLNSHERLREKLICLLHSPPQNYTDQQWQSVCSFAALLKLMAAQLRVLFNQKNVTDYVEIILAAEIALGFNDELNETILNFDNRLQHLLIDEFQDTSLSQFRLLEKLLQGWQPYDGRTIFLVGDPMQSIYRFREAEVGLFLRTQQEGINNIPLQSLTLNENFRSSHKVIDFVNETFSKIFPKIADINYGAVPFSPSNCASNSKDNCISSEEIEISNAPNEIELAQNLTNKISYLKKIFPENNISILVRSRKHLQNILPALNKANITYQAVDLEILGESLVIRDLFSLTRALFSLTDRVAWLAILRAPWCDLSLNDLYIIANAEHELIWENLCLHQELNLSIDAKQRIQHLVKVLDHAIKNKERYSWRTLLENAWFNLGGPKYLNQEEYTKQYANIYLDLLEKQNEIDISILEKQLSQLYLPSDSKIQGVNVQIMTIHKAKGLEFDHVIIPHLEKTGRNDEAQLLLWREHQRSDNRKRELLLAPIKAHDVENDPIYKYLHFCEKERNRYELQRLFYVAVTRAKKSVHLFSVDNTK